MGEKSNRSQVRKGGLSAAWGSSKRMRRINSADATKESAFSTKTVLRPNATAVTPPKAAPTAKLTDQVAEPSAFAAGISPGLAIFGITAREAGSNSAQHIVSRHSNVNSSHSLPRDCTKIMDSTMAARDQSANNITLR